jgi:hypothetical protein
VSVTLDSPKRKADLYDMSQQIRGSVDLKGHSPHRDLIIKLNKEKKEREKQRRERDERTLKEL